MSGDELLEADLCSLTTQIFTQFSVQLQGSEAPGYSH